MHGAAGRCVRDKRCERGGTRRNTVASGGRAGKQQTGARMKPSYAHRRSGVHLISTATRQLPRQPVDADHSCLIRKTTPLPIPRHGAGGMHLTLLAENVTAVESTGGPRLDVSAKAASVASRCTPLRDAPGKPARSFDWCSTKRDSARSAHALAAVRRQKGCCHRGGCAKAHANFRQGRHDGDARGRALSGSQVLSTYSGVVIRKLIPMMLIGMNPIGGWQHRWRD